MTKLDTFKILNLIETGYPLVTLKDDTVLKWLTSCELMDYSSVLKKLILHMRRNPYPPALEDILGDSSGNGTYFEWMDEYSIRTVIWGQGQNA